MKIENIMAKKMHIGSVDDTVHSIALLMDRHNIGFIPIAKEKKIVGVITDRDIVIKALRSDCSIHDSIEDYMSKKVITVSIHAELEDALRTMAEKKIKRLLVESDKHIVGIISLSDILKTSVSSETLVQSIRNIFEKSEQEKEEDYYI